MSITKAKQTNKLLLSFDQESQSDEEKSTQRIQIDKNNNKPTSYVNTLNADKQVHTQKQNSYHSNTNNPYIQKCQSNNSTHSNTQQQQYTVERHSPLRRNRSFKVKKEIQKTNSQMMHNQMQNSTAMTTTATSQLYQSQTKHSPLKHSKQKQLQSPFLYNRKQAFSRSVTKFNNIFEEVQEIEMKEENLENDSKRRNAIHEQQQEGRNIFDDRGNERQQQLVHQRTERQSSSRKRRIIRPSSGGKSSRSILQLSQQNSCERGEGLSSRRKDVKNGSYDEEKMLGKKLYAKKQSEYYQKSQNHQAKNSMLRQNISRRLESSSTARNGTQKSDVHTLLNNPEMLLMSKTSSTAFHPSSRDKYHRIKPQKPLEPQYQKINASNPDASPLHYTLERDTSGFNTFWPEFHLFDKSTKKHLISAKKKAINTTSNYYISKSQTQIDTQNQNYLGKVRSDFFGGCFNIFNRGANPENTSKVNKIRHLLATVIYESQVTNSNPKTMRVYIIKGQYNYYDLEGTNPKQEETNLEELYRIGKNSKRIHRFENRKPTYNKKQKKYTMNFNGRVKMASTKNFILEDPITKQEVMMMGKQEEDKFLVCMSCPLSIHIGMGIVLAELDNKIICE